MFRFLFYYIENYCRLILALFRTFKIIKQLLVTSLSNFFKIFFQKSLIFSNFFLQATCILVHDCTYSQQYRCMLLNSLICLGFHWSQLIHEYRHEFSILEVNLSYHFLILCIFMVFEIVIADRSSLKKSIVQWFLTCVRLNPRGSAEVHRNALQFCWLFQFLDFSFHHKT